MELLDEIRECFAAVERGYRKLESLDEKYPAWMVVVDGGYGIAVPYQGDVISERFAGCKLYSKHLIFSEQEQNCLILICYHPRLRYEFASVCAQFANPGESGIERQRLCSKPLYWWKNWKELLGNKISEKKPHSVIGEMLALLESYRLDTNASWKSIEAGSHDIETNDKSIEVKSTINRYGTSVTISSQFQLKAVNQLYLWFYRFEKSKEGVSINDVKHELIQAGYSEDLIERQLNAYGYEYGSSARDEKYAVLENRKYLVDGNFPKITNRSFHNNKIPEHITHIVYTIDLDGIPYE